MSASIPLNRSERTEHWREQIDAWQALGVSRARYCRENDLNYDVFNYWYKKLVTPEVRTKKLVPVAVSAAELNPTAGALQLRLPNGIHITSIQADSVQLVGQLIAQL